MTAEVKEIKCSTKQNIGVFVRNGKTTLLSGGSGRVVFSGLGAAIPSCITAASRLVSENVASIERVETGITEIADESGRVRNVSQLRVQVKVIPQSRYT